MEIFHINSKKVLLLGSTDTGKTTVAFTIATESCSNGSKVVYLCNKNKMQSKFPCLLQSTLIKDLANIQLSYINSFQELKKFAMTMNASPECLPNTIVIEDLSLIINQFQTDTFNDQMLLESALQVVSYINDMVLYIEENLSGPIQLIITDSCQDNQYMSILLTLVQEIYQLKIQNKTTRSLSQYDINAKNFRTHDPIAYLRQDDKLLSIEFTNRDI